MIETYLEIPRVFTSIAEIGACLIYIKALPKRSVGVKHYANVLFGALFILIIQLISGELPLMFWIPGMLSAMFAMFFYIWKVCDISPYDAGFIFVRAFILAEFIAAIEWQAYYYLLYKGIEHSWLKAILLLMLFYIPLLMAAYWIDARKVYQNRRMGIQLKELMNALIIGLATFSINNLNFVIDNPFIVRQVGASMLYVRSLVDFSGLLILFAWGEQRREMNLSYELQSMNDILKKHYNQYQASKDSIDMINRKYHDLKHQISLIKTEEDPQKRDEYFAEIDHAMNVYESRYDTGNTVIDTILTGKSLYCGENDIQLSCVVDGKLLDFMMVMDICSVFGNALDNCIESVEKIVDTEKRIIRVAVFRKNNFIIMRFENYFEDEIVFKDNLPVTTKENKYYHGFGIKSIEKTIEKYEGSMAITTDDKWFVVNILVPLPNELPEE